MPRNVELPRDQAEDILFMLTAFAAILDAPPLPERLFETLEPAVGSEMVRYGNPMGVGFLADRTRELRRLLIDKLGDDLINERLRK